MKLALLGIMIAICCAGCDVSYSVSRENNKKAIVTIWRDYEHHVMCYIVGGPYTQPSGISCLPEQSIFPEADVPGYSSTVLP